MAMSGPKTYDFRPRRKRWIFRALDHFAKLDIGELQLNLLGFQSMPWTEMAVIESVVILRGILVSLSTSRQEEKTGFYSGML